MPFPSVLVTRLFQLLNEGQIVEARRILQKLELCPLTTWEGGYIHALGGMFVSIKDRDRDSFVNKIKAESTDFKKVVADFKSRSTFKLYDEFMRGYFTAWTDYVQFSLKAGSFGKKSVEQNPQDQSQQKVGESPDSI